MMEQTAGSTCSGRSRVTEDRQRLEKRDLVVDQGAGGPEVGLEHWPETVTFSLPGAALGREGGRSCRKTVRRSPMGRETETGLPFWSMQGRQLSPQEEMSRK